MIEKIVHTEHLAFRLKARKIPKSLPARIYQEADRLYFDRTTQLNIAVKDILENQKLKILMIAFTESNGIVKMITIHPLKKNQEINRINSGRWLKIKRTI